MLTPQLDSAVTNAESWAQFLYYEKHGYTAKEDDAHPMRLFVLFHEPCSVIEFIVLKMPIIF